MKKGIELSLNTLIVAIIVLIVLVVVIAIFTGGMSEIAKKFQLQTDKAGEKGDEAWEEIGFGCKDGNTKTEGGVDYKCEDGKWVEKK